LETWKTKTTRDFLIFPVSGEDLWMKVRVCMRVRAAMRDIALDLMKFIANDYGVRPNRFVRLGFQGTGSAAKPEE